MADEEPFKQSLSRWKDHTWSTIWKTGLVRLPRVAPISSLHITNPGGPFPFVLQLPSRQLARTIPLYVFVPHVTFPHPKAKNAVPSPNVFPVVMDYHGGGFYLGSCLEQAPFCSKLCRDLQAIVIGVDYRMAPLDKFPAAIEDAEDVLSAVIDPQSAAYFALREGIAHHLRRHWVEKLSTAKEREEGKVYEVPMPEIYLDPSRIAFSGASSGGNIALNMALSVPESQGFPEWPCRIPADYINQIPLLLLYPSLDLRQLPSERFRHPGMPPVKEHKRLDIDDHLAATYVNRELAAHGRASPGLIDTSVGLHKQAKILLVLSGIDTLWEQSKIWCEKLEREGRAPDVKTMRYEDRKHGWTVIPEIALSADEKRTRLEVLDECVHFTRLAFDGVDPVKRMENEEEKGVTSSTPTEKAQKVAEGDEDYDHALAELLEMGFPAHAAQTALDVCGRDVDTAATWLMDQTDEMMLQGRKEGEADVT